MKRKFVFIVLLFSIFKLECIPANSSDALRTPLRVSYPRKTYTGMQILAPVTLVDDGSKATLIGGQFVTTDYYHFPYKSEIRVRLNYAYPDVTFVSQKRYYKGKI